MALTSICWRIGLGLSLASGVALASCTGPVVNLGGSGCAWGSSQPTCDGQGDAGGAPSDGSGYNVHIAPACFAVDGTMQTPTGAAQITQELVGLWIDCSGAGPDPMNKANTEVADWLAPRGDNVAVGVEFTADGHYYVLDDDHETSMPVRNTAATGTFDVQDASATLGAGAYQLRLQPDGGNVFAPQIVVFDSPRKIRLKMVGTANFDDLSPALPMSFRKGVCTSGALGPAHVFTGWDDVDAQLKGRWIWCSGPMLWPGATPAVGIEFPGDRTWYMLTEDASGNVARSTDPNDHGTYGPGGMVTGSCRPFVLDSNDGGGGYYSFTPTVGECRRALNVDGFDPWHRPGQDVLLPWP